MAAHSVCVSGPLCVSAALFLAVERLDEKIFTMMARNCGKKDDYFKKTVFNKKHADWFMDAQEAKKHGLVNHLRVPKLNIKVDVDIDFD